MKYQLKHEKKFKKLVKYKKISVDGYIFLNFVSVSTDIGYIDIYLGILILGYEIFNLHCDC